MRVKTEEVARSEVQKIGLTPADGEAYVLAIDRAMHGYAAFMIATELGMSAELIDRLRYGKTDG